MRRIVTALTAAAIVAPATASAGLVAGVRSGLAVNGGEIMATENMSNFARTTVPIQLEAGWKFADRLTLSGFATMNLGFVSGTFKDVCTTGGSDCRANETRVGGLAQWNFMPARRLDPWVAVGAAWEVLGIESITGTSGVNTNYQGTGWDVQAGADYWVSRRLSVSPYLGFSYGTYGERKLVSDPSSSWEPIAEKKAHSLFTVGVRLGFDLGGTPRGPAAQPVPPPSA